MGEPQLCTTCVLFTLYKSYKNFKITNFKVLEDSNFDIKSFPTLALKLESSSHRGYNSEADRK